MYKRNDFAYTTITVQIKLIASHQMKLSAMSHVGDTIVLQLILSDESKFKVATIYVDQRLGDVLDYWLLQYSDFTNYLGLEGAVRVPMVLVGYTRLSEYGWDKLKENLLGIFFLELNN